jgi:aminoglycoside phosphotransferase family enzyme/predicted kinase
VPPTLAAQRRQLEGWLRTGDPSASLTVLDTHVSVLAMQRDRVFKIKRAVRYPFVDLSTTALRRANCEREVALNRRLAPDVYLGVETVPATAECEAEAVVVMRRMTQERSLAAIIERGSDAGGCVRDVARVMADFHARAERSSEIDGTATADAWRSWWDQEAADLAPLHPTNTGAQVFELAHRYLAGRAPLFDARIAQRRVCDGHGDLLAGDVFCLDDGPRLLDCLEFDAKLRAGDGLADISFLAMDLERLGRSDLAQALLDEYAVAAEDDWPPSLEHFCIAARAHIRAKVAALRDDFDTTERLLQLARKHLERGRVRLVLVGGAPGSGKSTLARGLGDATGWPVLRSDVVRKELSGAAPSAVPLDRGIYTHAWTVRTYREIAARAARELTNGTSVIVDASFADVEPRDVMRTLARETASDLVALVCEAPIDVLAARADARRREGHDVSDADAAIATAVAARFASWPGAARVDTTERVDVALAAARDAVGLRAGQE